jgi:hypothetical protein
MTDVRCSELVVLTWNDIDLGLMQVNVRRSCVRNRFAYQDRVEPQTGSAPSVGREDAGHLEGRVSYPAENDFVFRLLAVAWQEADDAGHHP